MTPTDILIELAAANLEDASDMTRYAITKQAPTVGDIATEYGLLALTPDESAEVRAFLTTLLKRRLAVLEAQP